MNEPLSDAQIVTSPELPLVGAPTTLTVQLVGSSTLSDAALVRWSFRARDDKDVSWPWGNAEGTSIHIPQWTAGHQGTYYANIVDGPLDLRAARTIAPAIRVAMSGGGYRASLYGLGALLYLVDVRANYRIEDVASVSGGSIASGFVHRNCDLSEVDSEEFWTVVADFARRVSRRRVLPDARIPESVLRSGWAAPRLLVVLAVFALIVRLTHGPIRAILVAATVGSILLLLTLRGFWVERMLRKTFGISQLLDQPRRRLTHAFCATDLVAGEPFYFLAMSAGGFFYSRSRGAAPAKRSRRNQRGYPVSKAVRASAAFPGAFLPKRLRVDASTFRWSQEPFSSVEQDSSGLAYCADGGVANNLATQWHEESVPNDWPYRLIYGSELAGDAGWQPGREMLQIVIDASRPIRPTTASWFAVPVAAELRSVARVMAVLYENTITPRRTAATWERSWLTEWALEAHNRGRKGSQMQRGHHRQLVLGLDPQLSKNLENLMYPMSTVLARPREVGHRAIGVMAASKDWLTDGVVVRTAMMPTTLFKRSRPEVADAIRAGYLTAMSYCHAYESLGIPSNVEATLKRIDGLAN